MWIIKRMVGLFFAGALAFGLIVNVPGAAQASVTPPPGPEWAEIYGPLVAGGPYCLDVPNGTTSVGAILGMYHCHGYASNGASERWIFVHMNDGSYEIYNQSNLLCLTPRPASNGASGTLMQQFPCGPYAGQEWFLAEYPYLSNTYFQLQNSAYPNMCLSGENPELRPCAQLNYQVWALG